MTSKTSESGSVAPEKKGTEYLANERTFLAWIRTSVAVISLGFLVSRFSLWLFELGSNVRTAKPPPSLGTSFVLGEAMMAFGGLLAVLAAWRYHVVNRDIERGRVSADRGLVVLVTVAVAALAAAMMLYMLKIER
jgi:inner membrane protein YidH